MSNIRNFAIVAHIDHGKSTLADRLLELTGTVNKGSGAQLLDTMELEQERGITIKLNPARMRYIFNAQEYQLNLIDTPGHVDFGYEVSRSLAAVDGVLLLVDATQGIQAQTLANLHIVQQLNKVIIPVVNKIDLPHAQSEEVALSIVSLLGCDESDICFVSGKTGEGVEELLAKVITKIPPAKTQSNKPLKALVFDSFFDPYLGVVAYVRIIEGCIGRKPVILKATNTKFTPIETGYMQIKRVQAPTVNEGEIGYVATGLKDILLCRVGDTLVENNQTEPLPGYSPPKQMVYASFFAEAGKERDLLIALEKLQLNDASLSFAPINSKALGLGYTVGFLGMLHMEIVKERLEREFDVGVLVTTPTVAYRFEKDRSFEPFVNLEVVAPTAYYGAVTQVASQYRAEFQSVEYIGDRVLVKYLAPMSEIISDFYDRLKSVTSGYASMDYSFFEYREADLVAVDLLVSGEKIDALTQYMVRSRADGYGRYMVERLKELIPRQAFEVILQAAIGGKIIARADIAPFRKDVTAKLYGGDVTRKNKLLEKQKKGKKKMRTLGKVEVPSDVFVKLLQKN